MDFKRTELRQGGESLVRFFTWLVFKAVSRKTEKHPNWAGLVATPVVVCQPRSVCISLATAQ